MYRIKCSNGKYVVKTTYGSWITYSKHGKVWHSKNLVEKNLALCHKFVERPRCLPEYKDLTYTIEKVI